MKTAFALKQLLDQATAESSTLQIALRQYCKKADAWIYPIAGRMHIRSVGISVPGRKKKEVFYFEVPATQIETFIETAADMFKNEPGHRWRDSIMRMRLLGYDTCDPPKRDDW